MSIANWLKRKRTFIVSTSKSKKANIGIALSGGGAKGFAHIGVLKALNEHGIDPDVLSGTSMGSLVGVLYAAGKTPNKIQELVKSAPVLKMVKLAWGKSGMFQMSPIRKILENEVGEDNFNSLHKPFYLSVSNINEGKAEVFHQGELFDRVIASCSVPVLFMPQIINKITYVDGGLYDNLPTRSIRKLCKTLIGVHINYTGTMSSFKGMKEVAERTFMLAIDQNVKASMKNCDIVIDPPEMQKFTFWDFDKVDEIVEVGYTFTKGMIEKGEISSP